ncbi:hypothetical protein DICVIV_06510 [Dictyocaulus viviparus]|uniref:Uncharacterized protein n=1 Tax=Dictyocaulus viviparus TaxID=29172 RepID=A0A0D8XUF8_DICVI|nr:hypothetical protein DICVIV_06510 [Dictyocaulus viviparus]
MKGNYLAILHIISPALLNAAKGFMLLQESREHSSAHTQEKFPTTAFEDHVLDILELEEPPPVFIRRKRDDKVATFMAELYRELEDVDGGILSPTSGVEEWSIADRIVSVSPRDIQCSEGIIGLSFDYDDFPSSSASQLIASQLRIFLPEDLIFTRISIYRNKTGGLVVVDSTIVTSWQKTIGFNVTNIVSDWILGLTVPKLFIRVESGENDC